MASLTYIELFYMLILWMQECELFLVPLKKPKMEHHLVDEVEVGGD